MKPNLKISKFQDLIWQFYAEKKRTLPWREEISLYGVFVSEVMLQQTQVARVLSKYPEFLKMFPDFHALETAQLSDILRVWQGMGYNRRGKYLHESAKIIVSEYGGLLPQDPKILVTLPGIGKATASSISCFAYNRPEVFIETNIRRVILHHFFADSTDVPDAEVLKVVAKVLDHDRPRDWYYALMDYGSELAKVGENANKRSKHYARQSRFEGSDRQLRGQFLKLHLSGEVVVPKDKREKEILKALQKEGLIK